MKERGERGELDLQRAMPSVTMLAQPKLLFLCIDDHDLPYFVKKLYH